MKYPLCASFVIALVLSVLRLPTSAEDLVIVRSTQELASRGFDDRLRGRIARGHLSFHFGAGRRSRPSNYPYQTVIVYPRGYTNRGDSQYSGKDASGNLYFNGYPVVPSGWISVKVEPRDAAVLINGHSISMDANSGRSEKAGYTVGLHSVEVRKPGLTPYEGEVEVRPASEVHLDIKLTK
jgi:PEGA domain